MEEVEEELEPLFDYSRVQPADFIALDDDDDADSPAFSQAPKRKKCSNTPLEEKVDDEVVVLEGDKGNGDEEEDWLPPPPPDISDCSAELAKDKTIQELRLKKQELASFAWSAEDVMRTVIESAKKELNNSLAKSEDLEAEVVEAVKPKVDRPKILISIQDKDGHKQFRVFKDDKFERLFKMYANRINCNLECLAFCFDGDKDAKITLCVTVFIKSDVGYKIFNKGAWIW